MTICKAEHIDLKEILELQKICYQKNAERISNFSIAPLTQSYNEISEEFESSVFLKYHENNKIIGSVRAYRKNNTCYIGRLIVHPDFQNKGIGSQLMLSIEKEFKYIRTFKLFTGAKDKKNLYFYQKHGYKLSTTEHVNQQLTIVHFKKLKTLN